MRIPGFAGAAAVALFALGCFSVPVSRPAGAPAASSSPATKAKVDPRVHKLALILRAADLRALDSDLRGLLTDADPTVRAKAVLALGQIGDAAASPELATAATDTDPDIRANAAFSIGLVADPAGEAVVEKLATDPAAAVRAQSAEALGRLHHPNGRPAIRALLTDSEMPVRAAASFSAWKFAEPEPLLDALIENLRSTDAAVRIGSAYALARMASAAIAPPSSGAVVGVLPDAGIAKARAALVARVSDPEAEVRMNVARGLASPRAGAELAAVGTLSTDPNPGVRINAVRALGYPGIPIKPYLDRALSDRDQAVVRAALEAMGNVGGTAAQGDLNQMLRKVDAGWIREALLLSLTKVDPTKAPSVVREMLASPDPRMRAASAEVIAGHTEQGSLGAARSLLGDAAPNVVALGVPIVAGQPGAITSLLSGLFRAKDPVVRAAVGDAIGDRFAHPQPAAETFDDLFARLGEIWTASGADTIPDAKLAVLDAGAKAGRDPRANAILTRALEDPDILVRRRAVTHLKDIFGDDRSGKIAPATDRPIEDYERIVEFGRTPHAAIVSLQRPGTAIGRFTLALDSDAAPMAAWNFAELAKKSFFDNLTVHRVVPNFVVQDGDPRGDGFGGPGYSIRDEFNPLRFSAGVLGMASDGKDTAGSQWFVTLSPQPHLDGRYTSFGRVVRGFREIVTQIRPGDTVVSVRVYEGNGTEPLPQN